MKSFSTHSDQERAVLVGVAFRPYKKEDAQSHLQELAFLAETAGAKPVGQFIQQLLKPHPATFVGSGLLENISLFVKENQADVVIFDDELSPSQLRNIEKKLGCKILDRTNLILDIFATRARTAHARIQVELAQLQYLLPRLTRMWTHLERQQGGIGLRGPGETEIETDRRIIKDKISRLKKELVQIDRQKSTQRKSRGKLVRVALVGYTNAGKSTLLNLLGKSQVLVENKLFATLDTTVRKVVIKNLPFLLSDTVGFIHKLPHCLVESFKATLDEVREADLLLHVIDNSHPHFDSQIQVVNRTLREIGAADKPLIAVFNKIDLLDKTAATPPEPPPHVVPRSQKGTSLYISAVEKINIDGLQQELYARVKEIHVTRYPYSDFLYNDYVIS
jgi:GTP-binding protein HflX